MIEDYVDYGLELAVQSVPIPEAKTHDPPNVYFFEVIKQVNAIILLFENQLSDTLVPLIMYVLIFFLLTSLLNIKCSKYILFYLLVQLPSIRNV